MTTKFIGVKEFRQNIASLAKTAKKKNQRLVIMNRSVPILDVRPVADNDFDLSIERGLADMKAGRVLTVEQVKKRLGI